jgi:hypothetical protein
MEGTSTHFHIIRLQYHAALLSPKALQGENQILEGTHGGGCLGHVIYPLLKMGRKSTSIPQALAFPQRAFVVAAYIIETQ